MGNNFNDKSSVKHLRRRQLDRQFQQWRILELAPRPRRGWLREIRLALGMTSVQLAKRLGISQPAVIKLEQSEEAESITLKSLHKVAEAMNCTLVYALVPNDSLEATIQAQAQRRSTELVTAIEHTMRLEAQGRDEEEQTHARNELAQDLIRTLSRDLWEGKS